jgi:hypothetical protein
MHRLFRVIHACLILTLFPLFSYCQNAGDAIAENNVKSDTSKQKDLLDIGKSILKIKPKPLEEEKNKKTYFSILPISGSLPGGGNVLITATTAGFYLGDRDSTYLSSVVFTPYWNFRNRFGIPLRSNLWLANNTWNIKGDTHFMVYPQYTWGLGGGQRTDDKVLINYNYIRFYQSALKRIKSYFYAGMGYNLDYFHNIHTDYPTGLADFTGYDYGTEENSNSLSSGITLNLLYDTRNNSINPIPGVYANLIYRVNPTFLGTNSTTWRSLYLDARKYFPLAKRPDQQNVLAVWSYFWTILDSNVPYLNLPSIGMDPQYKSGRGIEQSRYRGKSLFYLESEYRRDITDNGLFGFVAFASINSVTEGDNNRFKHINPATGAGLRVKFNKGSNTNIAVDYGFSKGYSGVTVSLGEAF